MKMRTDNTFIRVIMGRSIYQEEDWILEFSKFPIGIFGIPSIQQHQQILL